MIPQPLKPQVGSDLTRWQPDPAYAGSGTSPRTQAFTLPGYGGYDLEIFAWTGNADTLAHAWARVVWFKHAASGSGARLLAQSILLGTSKPSLGGGDTNDLAIAVSDPSDTGVITVTVTWGNGTTRNPRVLVKGYRHSEAADFTYKS